MFEPYPPRRIAVFETFRESFRLSWSLDALRMPMLWLPVVLRLVLMWMVSRLPDIPENYFKPDSGHQLPSVWSIFSPGQLVAVGAMAVLYAAAALALSISWTRHLIRRETPTGAYFGRGFWRYVGYIALAYLGFAALMTLLAIPVSLLLMPGGAKDHPVPVTALIVAGTAIVGIMVWLGLSAAPFFISAAVEDRSITVKRSFAVMRGNCWRYLGGSLLVESPILVVQMFVGLATGGHPNSLIAQMIGAVVETPVIVFQFIVGATYMALVYRQLVSAQPERRVFDV